MQSKVNALEFYTVVQACLETLHPEKTFSNLGAMARAIDILAAASASTIYENGRRFDA